MIGDYPNLPKANNQSLLEQPLILPEDPEHMPDPFLDAQPITVDRQQQPSLNVGQPLDAQDWFAQAYHSQFGYQYRTSLHPEHQVYGQRSSPSPPLFAKLANLWHSDPAYKVFFIALATTLISGITCLFLISNVFKRLSPSQMPITNKTTKMSALTPVNIPTPTATPTPLATPTTEPTTPPAPQPAQLTVNISSISSTVINNTTTYLSVRTNKPGVHVTLYVTYSGASPSSFQGASATTNSNGRATLPWCIKVRRTKKFSHVTAHVTVFAQKTNGQTATSQTATVQVLTFQLG